MDNHNLMLTQLIEDLEKGKASVEHIRELLNQRCPSSPTHDDHHHHLHDEDHHDDDDDQDCCAKGLDHHSMVALRALDSALSMLHSCESVEDFKSHTPKSMDSHALAPRKDRRGCYKRRRNVESMVKDIDELSDDGFAWRKYGQKVILNTKHPRNYFRCTHKIDQGCLATKQVQQISENPTKYRIIYHGRHTCKSNITTPPIFLDSTAADNPDSPVYLNFGATATSPAKHALLSPPNLSFSHASSSAAMVKQEQGPIREETSSEPSDHHQYNSSSSSPSPSSPDPTTTTPRSGISSAEAFSSVTSTYHMDEDEDYYSQLMTLTEQFDMDSAIKGLLCV